MTANRFRRLEEHIDSLKHVAPEKKNDLLLQLSHLNEAIEKADLEDEMHTKIVTSVNAAHEVEEEQETPLEKMAEDLEITYPRITSVLVAIKNALSGMGV